MTISSTCFNNYYYSVNPADLMTIRHTTSRERGQNSRLLQPHIRDIKQINQMLHKW